MSEKKTKPEIRFKGFSEEWKKRKLGAICEEFNSGKNIKAENIKDNGTYPVYGGNGLRGYTDTYNHDGMFALIGRQGALCGNMNISSGKAYFTEHAVAVRADKNSDTKFLFYLLGTMNLGQYSGQSAQPGLAVNKLIELLAFISNYDEQIQISDFFTFLDNLISLKQWKYGKLKNVKKAMLEKMFPKDGADVPEIRFNGFSGKWELYDLDKIAKFSKGCGYSKNDLIENGIPIILYGRLYTNYQTVISEIDTFAFPKIDSVYSTGIEVIVPASGETAEDIARASVVAKSGALLGGDLNIIYPNDNINSIFLALTISYGKHQKELSKKAQGKSVVHLRNSDLKQLTILCPKKDEQIKIGNYFQNLDNLINLNKCELEKLKNIKKACLEKMFV